MIYKFITKYIDKIPLTRDYKLRVRANHEADSTDLKWVHRILTLEHKYKGWGCGDAIGTLYYQYFCSTCDSELTPGPSGGGTNQVCEKCKINFGCLPGGLER